MTLAEARGRFPIRIVEMLEVPAGELRANAMNWRTHPEYQRAAVSRVLERLGWVAPVLAYRTPDGVLELINGHVRTELADGDLVPVIVTDLTPREALEVLATHDEIASLAGTDVPALSDLVRGLRDTGVPLAEMGWPEYRLDQVLMPLSPPPAAVPFAAGGDGDPTGDVPEPPGDPVPGPVPGAAPAEEFDRVPLMMKKDQAEAFAEGVARLGVAIGSAEAGAVVLAALRRQAARVAPGGPTGGRREVP